MNSWNQVVPIRWTGLPLELLRGTPFNCLVEGGGEGASALKAVKPDESGSFTVPYFAKRDQVRWTDDSPVAAIGDNSWPGLAQSDAATAGPTNAPWIDSNNWYARLVRQSAPGRTLWLAFDPPAKGATIPGEAYIRAMADAEAMGARWIVSLDEGLRKGMAAGNPGALATWGKIAGAAGLFARHPEWRAYEACGAVGVMSDFAGENEEMSHELLNLFSRRNVPFRILGKSQPWTGVKALVALDREVGGEEVRRKLLDFAREGGLLVVRGKWPDSGTILDRSHPRLEVRSLGKGRLAVAKDGALDPFLVVRDAHMLLGRRNDLVRFYNISAFLSNYCTSADGTRDLLHLITFAPPRDVITAWFRRPYKAASLWEPGASEARRLEVVPENGGVAVGLPAVAAYAAVELS